MSGISFGKELKLLRKKVGISSKVLSQKVNKAVTYVSQLERGLIKNPDYETCKRILLELGLSVSEAEKMLDYFDIKSPEQEQAELDLAIKLAEQEELMHKSGYYAKKLKKLAKRNEIILKLFEKRFENFILFDHSRAEEVIYNLIMILHDEELFDSFFCSLFENNYSNLTDQERDEVLSLVNDYVREKENEKFINSIDEMEEK
jgi:transcriptional regulator with XRE-family HTH domain